MASKFTSSTPKWYSVPRIFFECLELHISKFQLSILQLSSVLDVHYTGVIDHVDENVTISLLIDESYTSDEEGSDEEEEEPDGTLDGVSDFDGIEDMSPIGKVGKKVHFGAIWSSFGYGMDSFAFGARLMDEIEVKRG
ncbi:WD repeat-containing protein 43 [Pyrus ussuriensis x Pyrus communis]|uniref:WD repeat-containing protein 43 n=1 Tax=Pyrus ussuriensis x Pyrus communis TaxID=2448454 RepID=A0A5N5G074_9ROSA|nr:WD repeat-containing protein 43 [Pyrus ussuriensis x Pyrus communis]